MLLLYITLYDILFCIILFCNRNSTVFQNILYYITSIYIVLLYIYILYFYIKYHIVFVCIM